ncbi:MAG: hypothetical protein NTY73_03145 [Candidatus Micrarchaeota archaeon]|nr:hypothetical protein [Candidatus Micrarchaeota archaeon]
MHENGWDGGMVYGERRMRRLWEHNMMTTQVMLRVNPRVKGFERRKPLREEDIFDRI